MWQGHANCDAAGTKRSILEIAAVGATGVVFLLRPHLPKGPVPFLVLCILGWGPYLAWRARTRAREWGLRGDTLKASSIACAIVTLAGAAALAAIGARRLPASAALVFAVYPLWALVQQVLVQGLLAGNLRRLRVPEGLVVPLGAAIFGVAHWPDVPLVILCTMAGALWTAIFLWRANVVPLALAHGWLGTLAYYWVLGRDPLGAAFG